MKRFHDRIRSTVRQRWVASTAVFKGRSSRAVGAGMCAAALGLVSHAAPGSTFDSDEDEQLRAAQTWALRAGFDARTVLPPDPGSLRAWTQGPAPVAQVALTTDTLYRNSTVDGDHLVVLGSRSALSGNRSVAYGNLIVSRGDNNTAIGHQVELTGGGYATGIGAHAVADGIGTTALGNNARAYAENSVAVGSGAQTHDGAGVSRIAIGGDAYAGTGGWTGAVALGGRARAEYDGLAIGYEAKAAAHGSVALGRGSVAREGNTVSVGSSSTQRRIVNVADGSVNSSSTDAVNGRQLMVAENGIKAASDAARAAQATANAANTTAGAARSIADALNARLNTSTLALGPGAAAERNTYGISTAVGNNAKGYNGKSVAVGDDARAGVDENGDRTGNYGGNGGVSIGASTRSGNGAVALGLKAAATGDRGIAIGHQSVGNATYATAVGYGSKATADSALALGERATAGHAGAVALGNGSQSTATNQVSVGNGSLKRRIVNVADAALGGTSSEAVTGRQLHATNQRLDSLGQDLDAHGQQLQAHERRIGDNRSDLDRLRSEFDEFDPDLEGVVKFSGDRRRVDLEGAVLKGLAAGDVSAASTEAVNGAQLFATNQRIDPLEHLGRLVALGTETGATNAVSGPFGVAIGNAAKASPGDEGGTAVGAFANALGRHSVAVGRAAYVTEGSEAGFALGLGSFVKDSYGVALGAVAHVESGAAYAVAVGAYSAATEAYTVSFGDNTIKRRLVNVGRGTGTNEATTFDQLTESLATLGGGAALAADGNVVAPTYRVQGGAHRTVGDALTALDGAVIKAGARVGAIENQLRSVFLDAADARADGVPQLGLAGTRGTVLTNVADGLIAPGSRDAVNGSQLHAVQQRLDGRIDGLAQHIDGRPQGHALDASAPASAVETPETNNSPQAAAADTGRKVAGRSSSTSEPAPAPQVDTRQLDEMLSRANAYTDGVINGLEKRLDRMDKRYNRLAAMNTAQSAMAMNTAGLQTWNRLGAGIGHAEGEAAMAVGYQRVLNPRGSATFSLHGAFTNSGERGVGLGVGVGW